MEPRKVKRCSGLLCLLFFLTAIIPLWLPCAQKVPSQEQVSAFDTLLKEMKSVFDSGGDNGLGAWVRSNKDRIGSDFILYIAQGAGNSPSEASFHVAGIIAAEKGDPKTQADVLYQTGKYYSRIMKNEEALGCLNEAGFFYAQINDSAGQGEVFLTEGQIYSYRGENGKALEMFKKAMPFFEKIPDILGQARACFGEGQTYSYLGENSNALAMYEQALPLFQQANNLIGQGNVYKGQGDVYSDMEDNAKALAMYEQALPLYREAGSALGQGNIYRCEGQIYSWTGDNVKALEMFDRALPFFETAQDPIGQGTVCVNEGTTYLAMGDNDKALAMYKKALPFYEKAQNSLGQGNVYRRLGQVYSRTGEHQMALSMYEKALPFFIQAQDLKGQANIYKGQGDVYLDMGERAKAFALFDEAIPLYVKLQSPGGQGDVYLSEGNAYLWTDEYAKALALYEKALPLFERSGSSGSLCDIQIREGDVYAETGQDVRALAMYEKALRIAEEIQSPVGQGSAYHGMGVIYSNRGERAKALDMYEKAFSFLAKAQHPWGQGGALEAQGRVYFSAGEWDKAFSCFERAFSFYERTQMASGQGYVRLFEGHIFLRRGEIVKALNMFEEAASFFSRAQASQGLGHALLSKGTAIARQGQRAEAQVLYEKGLSLLDKARAQASIPVLKKSFFQKILPQYDSAALFMLANGFAERGFRIVESMKARLFLDQLAENLANVDKGLDPALRERRDELMGKLSTLAKAIEQSVGKGDSPKLASLKTEREALQAEFEKLQIDIRLDNPAYAAVRYPEPVSLETLQKNVLKPGEILVEYYLSDEKAFAFVVSNQAFKAVELPAGSMAIRSAIQTYLAWIGNPYYKTEEEKNRIAAGASLYGQLLRPLEPSLSEGTTIIVVPDGELAKLPFESLVVSIDPASKQPIYLLKRYPIKYIQSASVLTFLRLQFKREGVTNAFIGFGDPVYDYEHFKKKEPELGSTQELKGGILAELNRDRFTRGGGTFDRLEGSGQEVKAVAEIFRAKTKSDSDKPEINLRLDASEENAKSLAMADYGYILFSCHGLLGDGYQCLVLSQVPETKEDGFLTLGEIMNSSYKAKLVVLSACETGKGSEERGEGVTGLTRAVMYAGTPAAVVSLWSVSDEATRQLMVGFFRHMIQGGLSKDEALRRAKLELIEGTKKFLLSDNQSVFISHPFFWAAFVMYGE
jgi:CHAT domain-containing protein/Tfp pilus assembly protein PilF